MARFTIPKTVPYRRRKERWPAGTPAAWDPYCGEPVIIVGPGAWAEDQVVVRWGGTNIIVPAAEITPLTPFARDLLDALRAGG